MGVHDFESTVFTMQRFVFKTCVPWGWMHAGSWSMSCKVEDFLVSESPSGNLGFRNGANPSVFPIQILLDSNGNGPIPVISDSCHLMPGMTRIQPEP